MGTEDLEVKANKEFFWTSDEMTKPTAEQIEKSKRQKLDELQMRVLALRGISPNGMAYGMIIAQALQSVVDAIEESRLR